MGKGYPHAGRRVALTFAVGATAAVLFWLGQGTGGSSHSADAARAPRPAFPVLNQNDALAVRYARACQDGDADAVMGLTGWMNERLQRVALETPGDEALEAAREELRKRILARPVEENRIRPEGVEDAAVFAPGADIRFDGSDRGREDLSQPVRERAWLRVEYTTPERALRDEQGQPIRSIRVGVNVSPDGYVVKAGVVGNLDLDRASIEYGWEENQGG